MTSVIGGIRAGPGSPVRVMGVVNASPESFYGGSVYVTRRAIRDRAKSIEDEGGHYVDVGGMSTAPYLETGVSEREESDRVLRAVGAVQDGCNLPISVDTCRAAVAERALEAGAAIVNDVSGLKHDAGMAGTARRHRASVVVCSYGGPGRRVAPPARDYVRDARRLLAESLEIASKAGIPASRIAIDPSIGFFRKRADGPLYTGMGSTDWVSRDAAVLDGLASIRAKRTMPVVVSVSNKSFLGAVTGRSDVADRAYGTAAAEAVAVMRGADIIRTHNVGAAADAASVASRVVGRRRRRL
ncbi:MAG: dihydropteroate synthase [Thaumarchaeota archaeon]|nr:dihydropteroate synthase [Nitrososphaerota archaeon]